MLMIMQPPDAHRDNGFGLLRLLELQTFWTHQLKPGGLRDKGEAQQADYQALSGCCLKTEGKRSGSRAGKAARYVSTIN